MGLVCDELWRRGDGATASIFGTGVWTHEYEVESVASYLRYVRSNDYYHWNHQYAYVCDYDGFLGLSGCLEALRSLYNVSMEEG